MFPFMRIVLLFFLFISYTFPLLAQDETPCPEVENKKAKKLYEQGIDKKK